MKYTVENKFSGVEKWLVLALVIVVAVLAIALFSTVVFAAPGQPVPVNVKLLNYGGGIYPVVITNVATNETITFSTINGEAVVDWNTAPTGVSQKGAKTGDRFRVSVLEQSQETTLLESGFLVTFNMEGIPAPVPTCNCPDTTQTAAEIIGGILAGSLVGGYIVSRRKTGVATASGKIVAGKFVHSHKNYTSYHSPDAMHSYQPHKKGEQYPNYSIKKNIDGKYDYIGG